MLPMEDRSQPVNDIGPVAHPRCPRPLPLDERRTQMMRRQAGLALEARIALFEALSRDAAWARQAVRVR
jgi:hypothetical protein